MKTTTFYSDLSDFHELVMTVSKTSFKIQSAKESNYRKYKNFDITLFRDDLSKAFDRNICSYNVFEDTFLKVLNKQAPLKKKIVRELIMCLT